MSRSVSLPSIGLISKTMALLASKLPTTRNFPEGSMPKSRGMLIIPPPVSLEARVSRPFASTAKTEMLLCPRLDENTNLPLGWAMMCAPLVSMSRTAPAGSESNRLRAGELAGRRIVNERGHGRGHLVHDEGVSTAGMQGHVSRSRHVGESSHLPVGGELPGGRIDGVLEDRIRIDVGHESKLAARIEYGLMAGAIERLLQVGGWHGDASHVVDLQVDVAARVVRDHDDLAVGMNSQMWRAVASSGRAIDDREIHSTD